METVRKEDESAMCTNNQRDTREVDGKRKPSKIRGALNYRSYDTTM